MAPKNTQALAGRTMLICGGCGFMGSNFIHTLFARVQGVRVINLDFLTYAGNADNLAGVPKERYRFVQGDIADKPLVKRLMRRADFIVNFAAETHVDRSIHENAPLFVRTNIIGVEALLEALRESPRVKKMVQISTDEVWGDLPLNSDARFTEETPFRPNSPYAASKAAGDLLVRAYTKTYGLPVIVSHSVNNFGPRQFPEKLIPFFTLRALRDESLPLYGDGRNVRDWLFVDDHSAAILTLLEKGQAGEVFAISCGDEHSNIDIATKILVIVGKPRTRISFVKDRPAHDRRYSVDSRKLRALGWKPTRAFDETLKETVRWYADNKAWVSRVLERNKNINAHIGARILR